jgi:hypothetical protein
MCPRLGFHPLSSKPCRPHRTFTWLLGGFEVAFGWLAGGYVHHLYTICTRSVHDPYTMAARLSLARRCRFQRSGLIPHPCPTFLLSAVGFAPPPPSFSRHLVCLAGKCRFQSPGAVCLRVHRASAVPPGTPRPHDSPQVRDRRFPEVFCPVSAFGGFIVVKRR